MLQSFLLIDEFAASRSRASSFYMEAEHPTDMYPEESPVESKLREMGMRVYRASSPSTQLQTLIGYSDAALLSVPVEQLGEWCMKLTSLRHIPILFWCDKLTFPQHSCKLEAEIDGMLSPGMTPTEIHCSLMLSFQRFMERHDWRQEREQLLSKLEERKWVDQAKRILCEIKQISEAEAYDFLRKQAMNERKRMVDVATSIVKVYQLLKDQKHKGGRNR
ncbi:ANTAR domain-containing response regulator [Paenibacillus allorhizosphaerae]|uniref:ANTAR domain-containing protein n=1 Tax=Paenibacillus allorhizosphaerae TaxID=2849866 RepID=A0ABN7TGE8_9BACL|nr:ANTAR domain-containing protein [Paenibacillus allorhizosphaerae]CAG7628124.1 hypothetical protein PAECIP111802_01424 [Paenibacillus allorhizosphaerae]